MSELFYVFGLALTVMALSPMRYLVSPSILAGVITK